MRDWGAVRVHIVRGEGLDRASICPPRFHVLAALGTVSLKFGQNQEVRIGNVNAKIFEPSWKELRQGCLVVFGHRVYSDVLQVNSMFLARAEPRPAMASRSWRGRMATQSKSDVTRGTPYRTVRTIRRCSEVQQAMGQENPAHPKMPPGVQVD